ncbi:MAG: NusG domain II-containing protein [Oscillospiraceae bacterium]
MKKMKFLKKRELIIVALVIALSLSAMLIFSKMESGFCAVVAYNGVEIQRIPLSVDKIYFLDGDLPVSLEVRQGKIRFVGSQCPDKLCEGFGFIGREYDCAICMPAGISVQIVAENP